MNAAWTVREVEWHTHRAELHAVRKAVFVDEQRVPEELEWDDIDSQCRHVLAYCAESRAIGTGRLLPDAHIGRMAVLKAWRGRGVGSAILRSLVDLARRSDFREVHLHAQTHALDFYAGHGFTAIGAEFMEAGIPHRTMVLQL